MDQLRVRTEPTLDAPLVTFPYADNNVVAQVQLELHDEFPVWLLDEPAVTVDGYVWRAIAVNNLLYNDGSILSGWVADAGPDGSPWLAPFSNDCPALPAPGSAIDHLDLQQLRMFGLLGPACFRSDSISFTAYWPPLPPDAGLGGLCPGPEPRWLLCTNIHYAHVNVTGDTGWDFPVYAPNVYEQLGGRGRWLLLTGHFDDPVAEECRAAAGADQGGDALELFCRTRFVLESVTPVPPPA